MQTQETSLEAFERIKPDRRAVRESIFVAIALRGLDGSTCDEIERALAMSHQTASARVNELHTSGRIIAKRTHDGALIKRKTRTGSPAIVWIAPEQPTLPLK